MKKIVFVDTRFLYRVWKLLPRSAHFRLLRTTLMQLILGVMDLIGVFLIGVVGGLSISGIESHVPPIYIVNFLNYVKLNDFTFQNQVAIIALCAATLFVLRTFFSLILNKNILQVLATEAQHISRIQVKFILNNSNLIKDVISSHQISTNLTTGLDSIFIGYIGNILMLISDSVILSILTIGLFIVNPALAFFSFVFFFLLAFILHTTLSKRGKQFGLQHEILSVETSNLIYSSLGSFRELSVHGRMNYQAMKISKIRNKSIINLSNMAVLPNIGKYVMESSVILGGVFLAGYQFLSQNAYGAVSTLAIFMAAGSRIAPSVLRIQQSLLQINYHLGMGRSTLSILETIPNEENADIKYVAFSNYHEGFSPVIKLERVYFKYPESSFDVLKDISLDIFPGETIAIVGPTGSGKSTLVDVILGIRGIIRGKVQISSKAPKDAINSWPGAISYVPQEIELISGTFRDNICFGYDPKEISDDLIWDTLRIAKLHDFVKGLPNCLDTVLGEGGTNLSGGQKQRLGIARALITNPKVLVLDEATSALDGVTENEIADSINNLAGSTTVIIIAHRLSTIRDVNKIVYLDNGTIKASGTFSLLRKLVPDFDLQAKLMNL